MTIKVLKREDLTSFDSSMYPWCIVTATGHMFYQEEDIEAYCAAMTTIGLTVDNTGSIDYDASV